MNIVMIGPFGLQPKATMSFRALLMAKALVARGHSATLLIPPWDHIVDGETGLLVTPENDGEFADAVPHLLADPELRTRLGTAAARRMREYFAWDRLVEEVETAYA
jgi:hypothetical protein